MNDEYYLSFEAYINNEMTQDELQLFEQNLQSDAKFRADFDAYKETTQFLERKFSQESQDFKNSLSTISKQEFASLSDSEDKNKSKIILFKPWHYSIAASLVLFIGIFIFLQNGTPEYTDYNQHETAAFVERGSIIKNLRIAQDAFNKKEFAVAVENFKLVLKEYDKPEIRFFYGIALVETNQFAEAETTFLKLKQGKSIYKDKAVWNLALLKLKQKNYDDCKVFLKQVPQDADDFEKAQKLLNELE